MTTASSSWPASASSWPALRPSDRVLASSTGSSGVTEQVCVSVRPLIEGPGRPAGDLVHSGGDGRVVEFAGAVEAEERVDKAGGGAVGHHAGAGLVVGRS